MGQFRYNGEYIENCRRILGKGDYEDYRYRMMLCHIPVVYVDKHGYFEKFRNEWVDLLNSMKPDIGLSGHKHVMWPLIPGQVEPNTTLVYSKAYSGVEGAFAHIAAGRIFPEGNRVSYSDFKAAYDSVVRGESDVVVLPIENSYAGEVGQTIDLIFSGEILYEKSFFAVLYALFGCKCLGASA